MNPDKAFFDEKAVVKRFRDNGFHPQQTTTWPDSSMWVLVPPWEVRPAKRLAQRVAEVRDLTLSVYPLTNPHKKGK